jgi:hypothetical protein
MPLIFGDAEPEYADLDEVNEVLGEVMSLYNEVNAASSVPMRRCRPIASSVTPVENRTPG